MTQLDLFLAYLNQVNEGVISLTSQDYTKICTIRDQVTDLAKQFIYGETSSIVVQAEPGYGKYMAAEEDHSNQELQAVNMDEYKVLQYDEFVNEMIVKDGNKWLVKDKKGKKVLGTHPSRKKALAQLRAIEISKAGR
jgi:cytoplasmic iron level regulating protein YaaA (DUF328/UPF0246 family)